ncbi:MAG: hypothetical protein V4543_11945 [Bacteroidota bacterium]
MFSLSASANSRLNTKPGTEKLHINAALAKPLFSSVQQLQQRFNNYCKQAATNLHINSFSASKESRHIQECSIGAGKTIHTYTDDKSGAVTKIIAELQPGKGKLSQNRQYLQAIISAADTTLTADNIARIARFAETGTKAEADTTVNGIRYFATAKGKNLMFGVKRK